MPRPWPRWAPWPFCAPEIKDRIPFLAALDGFRFRRQVGPGDLLRLDVTLSRLGFARAGRGHGIATVEGNVAAEGDIMFVIAGALPD